MDLKVRGSTLNTAAEDREKSSRSHAPLIVKQVRFLVIQLFNVVFLSFASCHPAKKSDNTSLDKTPVGARNIEDLSKLQEGSFSIKCLGKESRETASEKHLTENLVCSPDPLPNESLSGAEVEELKKIVIQPTYNNQWVADWSVIIGDAVVSDAPQLLNFSYLKNSEVKDYCPGYTNLRRVDKLKFWVFLFANIARFESAFNPKMRYEERKDWWSEGLLQLSYGDEKQHRDCKISLGKKNIFSPEVNLHCGVVIMRSQLLKTGYGKIFTHGYFYYWSVLRNKIGPIDTELKKHLPQIKGCK